MLMKFKSYRPSIHKRFTGQCYVSEAMLGVTEMLIWIKTLPAHRHLKIY